MLLCSLKGFVTYVKQGLCGINTHEEEFIWQLTQFIKKMHLMEWLFFLKQKHNNDEDSDQSIFFNCKQILHNSNNVSYLLCDTLHHIIPYTNSVHFIFYILDVFFSVWNENICVCFDACLHVSYTEYFSLAVAKFQKKESTLMVKNCTAQHGRKRFTDK